MKKILPIILILLGGWLQICVGQTDKERKRIVPLKTCVTNELENGGYKVRNLWIVDPFDFLPWIKTGVDRAKPEISKLFATDKTFNYSKAIEGLNILDTRGPDLPDTTLIRARLKLEFVSVENCADGQLDLVYHIYSSEIMPVLSSTAESRLVARETPQFTAGFSKKGSAEFSGIQFSPAVGYDSLQRFYAGGRLEIRPKRRSFLQIDKIFVEGASSTNMKNISAGIAGSSDSGKFIAHSDWRLEFNNHSLPTGSGTIKGGSMMASYSAITRPLFGGGTTVRFGTMVDGGHVQSSILNVPLPAKTLPTSAFGSLKLYAGFNSLSRHNVLSMSYGLELGALGQNIRIDWLKYIGDIRHQLWFELGDHHIVDLESRLNFGVIQIPGRIPLSKRFFGGNNERLFVANDAWQIRESPVIRAIPGNEFFQTPNGAGGDRFFSYNFTAAYAIWRRPLTPSELNNDPKFKQLLNDTIDNLSNAEPYLMKDPAYIKAADLLPATQTAVNELDVAVTNAQTTHHDQYQELFSGCTTAITTAKIYIEDALDPSTKDGHYGDIQALLPEDSTKNTLAAINNACVTKLNATLHIQAIDETGARLRAIAAEMESDFTKIDVAAAEARAKADLVFVRRTVDTLLNDVNLFSVSPVFIFDAARMSRKISGIGGVRYGPGIGLRFELASSVNFTLGYARNVRRGPGEGSGNIFFSMGFRELFH